MRKMTVSLLEMAADLVREKDYHQELHDIAKSVISRSLKDCGVNMAQDKVEGLAVIITDDLLRECANADFKGIAFGKAIKAHKELMAERYEKSERPERKRIRKPRTARSPRSSTGQAAPQ